MIMTTSQHSNEENVVKCPVEGCPHTGLSRGMHLHVRQSSGDGHGENGDVPPNISLDDLEVVGTKEVQMDYPDERNEEDVVRLCPYCGRAFNGFRGIKIHVGQKVGQGVHPDNATDIEKEDCPIAHVDDDMNVIEIVEERSMMPSTKQRLKNEQETIKKAALLEIIEELENEGKQDAANKLRTNLL